MTQPLTPEQRAELRAKAAEARERARTDPTYRAAHLADAIALRVLAQRVADHNGTPYPDLPPAA